MKSILDPTFNYTPAASTDIRKTFARVRREMRKAAQGQQKYSSAPAPMSLFDRLRKKSA
jgi:hypothetical protein